MSKKTNNYSVLILINVRWWNATAYYAVNIARILQKKGHKIIIGCSKNYPAYIIARSYGIATIDLNFYGFNPFRLLKHFIRLLRIIKHEKIQIINSHRSEDHTFALLAKLITKVKHVITRGDRRKVSRNFLSKKRYHDCDAVILTCKSIRHQNESVFSPIQDKISIIYGSVDEDHFKASQNISRIAEKYKINTDNHIVGIVGRLGYVKDQYTLLRAAEIVLRKNKKITFIIAGKESQIKVAELKHMMDKLNIADYFIILPVIEDIADLTRIFDIGIITSIGSETISRVLLEYLYMGKPVIGTRINAIGEIIEPGINGELIDPGDHHMLARYISKIVATESLMKEYGKKSYELYQNNYSEKIFYEKHINIFKHITG